VQYSSGLEADLIGKNALFDAFWLSSEGFEELLLVEGELRHQASRANAGHLVIFPQLIRHLSPVSPELDWCFGLVRELADGANSAPRLSPALALGQLLLLDAAALK
jgi:hypothetical protein